MELLLGIPAPMLPGNAVTLRAYMDGMAADRQLSATPEARAVARRSCASGCPAPTTADPISNQE